MPRRAREPLKGATRGAVHDPRRLIELLTETIHLRNRHKRGEVSARHLKGMRGRFEARMRELARPARGVPAYEALSGHLWAHIGEWFAFLGNPGVEPKNGEGERAIRLAAVNRKVWGGNRAWPGARAQEVLMSVLVTCGRAGRSGLDFVSETLRAFGNAALPRPVLITPR